MAYKLVGFLPGLLYNRKLFFADSNTDTSILPNPATEAMDCGSIVEDKGHSKKYYLASNREWVLCNTEGGVLPTVVGGPGYTLIDYLPGASGNSKLFYIDNYSDLDKLKAMPDLAAGTVALLISNGVRYIKETDTDWYADSSGSSSGGGGGGSIDPSVLEAYVKRGDIPAGATFKEISYADYMAQKEAGTLDESALYLIQGTDASEAQTIYTKEQVDALLDTKIDKAGATFTQLNVNKLTVANELRSNGPVILSGYYSDPNEAVDKNYVDTAVNEKQDKLTFRKGLSNTSNTIDVVVDNSTVTIDSANRLCAETVESGSGISLSTGSGNKKKVNVSIDNNTLKLNGLGQIYADVSTEGVIVEAGQGITIGTGSSASAKKVHVNVDGDTMQIVSNNLVSKPVQSGNSTEVVNGTGNKQKVNVLIDNNTIKNNSSNKLYVDKEAVVLDGLATSAVNGQVSVLTDNSTIVINSGNKLTVDKNNVVKSGTGTTASDGIVNVNIDGNTLKTESNVIKVNVDNDTLYYDTATGKLKSKQAESGMNLENGAATAIAAGTGTNKKVNVQYDNDTIKLNSSNQLYAAIPTVINGTSTSKIVSFKKIDSSTESFDTFGFTYES